MTITKEIDGSIYVYEENFWTGKKELIIDDKPMTKIKRNVFINGSTGEQITVKGNFLTGVSIEINGIKRPIQKNKWYEWILIFIPYVMVFVGGVVGALLGVAGCVLNTVICRSKMNIFVKILLCLLVLVGVVLAYLYISIHLLGLYEGLNKN